MSTESNRPQELLDLCHHLVARARDLGATDAEVYAEHGMQTNINIEQSDIKGATIDEHQAVGLRLLVGGSEGFAYTNRLDPDSLDEALKDALSIAKSTPGDPSNGLVDPEPLHPVEGLFDDELAAVAPDEAVERTAAILRAALAVDRRVSAEGGGFTNTVFHTAIASSKGVAAKSTEGYATYGVYGMAVDGEDVGSFEHEYRGVRKKSEVDEAAVGRLFGERAIALLDPVEGTSYRGRVAFGEDAFEEIFLAAILSAIDGDNVFKGKSRWKDKLGERVASEQLTIVDDGRLPFGLGSSVHDREGLPHRRTVLVENGVLRAFLYDGKAARRAGKKPTGHASGSARTTPYIGTTNLDVGPGTLSDEALLKELGTGLFVNRFSGRVDGVSGDFSGVAKASFRVEGGERTAAVKETLVAGNVFSLLEQIAAVGKEPHVNMTTRCPWFIIDGVDVTAG